jgi:hypothetical protein
MAKGSHVSTITRISERCLNAPEVGESESLWGDL